MSNFDIETNQRQLTGPKNQKNGYKEQLTSQCPMFLYETIDDDSDPFVNLKVSYALKIEENR